MLGNEYQVVSLGFTSEKVLFFYEDEPLDDFDDLDEFDDDEFDDDFYDGEEFNGNGDYDDFGEDEEEEEYTH